MRDIKTTVVIQNTKTDNFEINSDVRQGDALSALLFNLILHAVISKINVDGNLITENKEVSAYADDIVIMGRNKT